MSNLPPLHAAAKRGDLEAVRRLLRRPGIDANEGVGNRPSKTPIYFAARSNSIAVAEELLRNGADLNPRFCIPPLHAAASNNYLDMMDLLIKSGADLNAPCMFSSGAWTALSEALLETPLSIETVFKLLDAGADPNAGEINKPLDQAVRWGSHEVTKVLLKAGAHPGRQLFGGFFVLQYAVAAISGPADSAVGKESLEMVAALIAAGTRWWSRLPTPCPRLERALPAVAATSPQHLPAFFKHLENDVKVRIRCTLLLLNRYIPEKHLRGKILTAMLTDEGETLPLEDWLPESILDKIRLLDI